MLIWLLPATMLACLYLGLRFGAARRSIWKTTLPLCLVIVSTLVVDDVVGRWVRHGRDVERFKTQPHVLHVPGEGTVDGVLAPDGATVTYTLSGGRRYTVGPPPFDWWGFDHSLKRAGIVFSLGAIGHLIAWAAVRLFGLRGGGRRRSGPEGPTLDDEGKAGSAL